MGLFEKQVSQTAAQSPGSIPWDPQLARPSSGSRNDKAALPRRPGLFSVGLAIYKFSALHLASRYTSRLATALNMASLIPELHYGARTCLRQRMKIIPPTRSFTTTIARRKNGIPTHSTSPYITLVNALQAHFQPFQPPRPQSSIYSSPPSAKRSSSPRISSAPNALSSTIAASSTNLQAKSP